MARRKQTVALILLTASVILLVATLRSFSRAGNITDGALRTIVLVFTPSIIAVAVAMKAGKGVPMALGSLLNGNTYTFRSETCLYGNEFVVLAEDGEGSVVVFISPVSFEASFEAKNGDQFMRATSRSIRFV